MGGFPVDDEWVPMPEQPDGEEAAAIEVGDDDSVSTAIGGSGQIW